MIIFLKELNNGLSGTTITILWIESSCRNRNLLPKCLSRWRAMKITKEYLINISILYIISLRSSRNHILKIWWLCITYRPIIILMRWNKNKKSFFKYLLTSSNLVKTYFSVKINRNAYKNWFFNLIDYQEKITKAYWCELICIKIL